MSAADKGAPAPLIDLHRLLVSIRRRRRTWLSFALLGVLAGGLLTFLVPPKPTAVTRLLVVHEQDTPSDGGMLMRTDIALMQTTRMAEAALARLGSDERPEDFLQTFQSTGLTSNVMELTVEGRDDADAVARATALAEVFIADHVQRIRAAADADAKALIDQRTKTEAELAEVDAAIAATPVGAGQNGDGAPNPETAAQLETLYARRAELASSVSDLSRQAEEAAIGAPRVEAGTQVVDTPRALPRSLLRTGATSGGLGLVIGLLAGIALAAVSSVVKDRPVLRREVSAHLGASVIAQLPARRRGPAALWRRSRGVAERRRVAATLVRAVRGGPGTVSLLEIGCPRQTAELAMDVAKGLATGEQGNQQEVRVLDDLPKRDVTALAADGPVRVVDGADLDQPVWPGERRLGVGSAAPGTAWTDLERLGSETVLVVRAGHANTAWLHTVARQLADREIPVIGVVLVAPDPKDPSDGTLWDGLHTALRGRAGATRTNGHTPERAGPVRRRNGTAPISSGDLPTKRFAPVRSAPQDQEDL